VTYIFENLGRYSFFYAQKNQSQQGFGIMKLTLKYIYFTDYRRNVSQRRIIVHFYI
ncbi:hypothetical protein J2T20_003611, partial [Paenibacillus wynnii]|nr:hypothetical protein [Paenibacillus wynnii]